MLKKNLDPFVSLHECYSIFHFAWLYTIKHVDIYSVDCLWHCIQHVRRLLFAFCVVSIKRNLGYYVVSFVSLHKIIHFGGPSVVHFVPLDNIWHAVRLACDFCVVSSKTIYGYSDTSFVFMLKQFWVIVLIFLPYKINGASVYYNVSFYVYIL